MNMKKIALGLSLGLAMLAPLLAQAGTTSSTFTVTATVSPSCQINSTGAIAFGTYDPVVANKTVPAAANGSVAVTCTKTTVANVSLDQGLAPTASSTCVSPTRQMKSGTNALGYAIYQDAAFTKPWGCDASNQNSFTSASGVTPQTLVTYGQIAAAQDVPTGSYTDTVTVTVSF